MGFIQKTATDLIEALNEADVCEHSLLQKASVISIIFSAIALVPLDAERSPTID